jgi:hypothetical protein
MYLVVHAVYTEVLVVWQQAWQECRSGFGWVHVVKGCSLEHWYREDVVILVLVKHVSEDIRVY